jgi:hypothetical protein
MTPARLREIAALLERFGDIETCPVILRGESVIEVRAIDDLNRFADELEDSRSPK